MLQNQCAVEHYRRLCTGKRIMGREKAVIALENIVLHHGTHGADCIVGNSGGILETSDRGAVTAGDGPAIGLEGTQ